MKRTIALVWRRLAVPASILAFAVSPVLGQGEVADRKIAPQDTILIEVFGEELLTKECKVQATGNIIYPLLESVEVAGKTTTEVALFLKDALDKDYLVNPQVTVTVKEYAIRSVNVGGQVEKPGALVIPAEQQWTILDAILYAGGFTRLADKKKIEFTRRGKTQSFTFDQLKKNSEPPNAIMVEPGDLIFVRESLF